MLSGEPLVDAPAAEGMFTRGSLAGELLPLGNVVPYVSSHHRNILAKMFNSCTKCGNWIIKKHTFTRKSEHYFQNETF